VHARSTHVAAIDSMTGELRRARFGPGLEPVVDWLGELAAPVPAAYEAGPTGYGLARMASAAGIEVAVVAPSKTPRASGDRVKTDRKDAELLARLLLAGQLRPVTVPPDWLEAIRHLARAREHVRRDLGRACQRVSKLLLVHGRVYPEPTTWNARHRRWLSGQTFEHEATELALIDLLAAVDGLSARRAALDERLSRLAQDPRLWPTVARLRCFRGVDTLTALLLHLELGGDRQRFHAPRRLSSWLGLVPTLEQSGESATQDTITRPAPRSRAGCWSRPPGTTRASPTPARPCALARPASPTTSCRSPPAPNAACTASTTACGAAASRTTSPRSPSPANSPASSGPPPPRHDLTAQPIAVTGSRLGAGPRPPARAMAL
jgi:transposase